ncbi:FkbM family methyltransferase [Comamonas aquatica]|uniref:FkbM family methyltransferase n=1 Tax=Comamonas aquatica TaxID=225991 RepID=UPI00391B0052
MNITSYAQNFEDVMLWRALGHIERGLYIDIGAQDPIIDSVSLAFHEHGWQGIHVEPTPHYAALLRQKRPGDTVIQAAVGSDSGVLHFFEIPDTGISTADDAIAAQHRARGFDVHETNVPCIPLSAVFQLCAEQEIHWLKIDVEGFEQQVLSSWGTSSARPWIVVVESTLPLTQIDTHQSWESILVGYGYISVYFDGLNRYYVSEAHSELKAAFSAPPNVFDGFALNGTASAPFHQLIAARCQEKISEAEKQLAALALSHREQERTMQEHQAEQEQALQQKLQALEAQLDRLQQERAASEKLLHAQNSQSRQELERLLRQLVQREQEVAAQLLQAQQQAEREKIEQAHRHAEHATALQQQYAEREQALQQKLQALEAQLDRLQQERAASETLLHEQNSQSREKLESALRQLVQREQEVAAQLLQAQQQAEREKIEQAHRHAEHATALQQQYAEREQALQQKLQALEAQLDRLQQERAASETLLHEQNSQSRQELERLLRQLVQREQEVAAQLLQAQQQAEREKTEQAHRHAEHATALQQQYAEREQALQQKLQALQAQLDRLQQERAASEMLLHEQNSQSRQELERLLRQLVQREQEVAAQLLQAQQQAEREKTEQAHRHAEHATALQQQYAEREQALQQKLQALQAQLDRLQQECAASETLLHEQNSQSRQELESVLRQLHSLEREWAQNEKALSHEIAALQRDVQALHHARQLLAQQHDAELKTKLGEHQRVLAACAALESELKAQVLLEQQASLQLRQSLAEVQHQLGMVHTSFSWRLTAPLRKLASCIAPERVSAAAFPCKDTPSTPAQQAAAMRQAIDLPMTTSCLEPEIAPATLATHVQAPDSAMVPQTPGQPVAAALSINDLRLATESSLTTSFAPVNMPLTPALVAAATLDELLAQHDQYFIQCAYLTLLGREPDPEGLNYYLSRLRTGYSKIQILAQLSLSNEGKAYASQLSGLDVAIAHYQKSQYPLLGWLYRWVNGLEGNHPNERKLRSIENQLFAFSHESKCRFNQLETAIASLHHLVAQEAQVITAEVTGEDLIASGKSKTISVQPPEPEGLNQLSPRARDIYFQLKKAAAIHAGEVA